MRTKFIICFIKIWFAVLLVNLLSFQNIYASTFGQSCTALPIFDSTNYLINDTAYGFVQKTIDMKTYVTDACKPEGNEFKFCIKNKEASPICTPKTMTIGSSAKLGTLTNNIDITSKPSLANIILSVAILENKVCLMMPTSRGPIALMCRDKIASNVTEELVATTCKSIGQSCFDGATKSQSLFNFSGLTINCLRDTLNKVFYVGNECRADMDNQSVISLRSFPEFQDFMRKAVTAALILYVMVYGFQITTNSQYANLDKISVFLVKIILVTYFSIGLGSQTIIEGRSVRHNGMTEFALPLLVELTSDFTEYVFQAGGAQGLCNFDKAKYSKGYEFYKVWDAIDCRIGYYLGMQLLYNMGTAINSLVDTGNHIATSGQKIDWGDPSPDAIDTLKETGSFTYFTVMFGFFMAGQIIIVIMGLVFAIMLISILLYFLTAYLVCSVTLYVLAYVAPIFIPMVLFDRTKSYFDSWLKLVISCALQPAVIGGFIALMLTVYDSAIYGNCEYKRHDYTIGEQNFSTFELLRPAVDAEKCEASLGYKLMKYYLGMGWEKKSLILFEIPKINDYLNIALSLVYMIIYMVVFYYFMRSINEFVSDLVGGASLSAVTVSPNAIIDKAKNAAGTLASLATSRGKTQAGGVQGGATHRTASSVSSLSGHGPSAGGNSEGAKDLVSSADGSGGGK